MHALLTSLVLNFNSVLIESMFCNLATLDVTEKQIPL